MYLLHPRIFPRYNWFRGSLPTPVGYGRFKPVTCEVELHLVDPRVLLTAQKYKSRVVRPQCSTPPLQRVWRVRLVVWNTIGHPELNALLYEGRILRKGNEIFPLNLLTVAYQPSWQLGMITDVQQFAGRKGVKRQLAASGVPSSGII